MEDLLIFIFGALKESLQKKVISPIKAGFELENLIAKILEKYGLPAKRKELELPTFSGLKHQFDVSLPDNSLYWVIECKRKKSARAEKTQIYAFVAKLLDHAFGLQRYNLDYKIKGVFVSSAKLTAPARAFALSFGVIPIDPTLPPIEYMLSKTKKKALREELEILKEKLSYTLPHLLRIENYTNQVGPCLSHWKSLSKEFSEDIGEL